MKQTAMTYDLPDIKLLESDKPTDFSFWIPNNKYVVMGRSDEPDKAVYTEKALREHFNIIKRPSGGHTVILTPNTLVISAKFSVNDYHPKEVFKIVNQFIILALRNLNVYGLHERGISDIAIGNKKILGSSIYRTNKSIFYHAVLNVSENPEIIDKLLKHPIHEPDYRKNRSHGEFVTSLTKEGYSFSVNNLFNYFVKSASLFQNN